MPAEAGIQLFAFVPDVRMDSDAENRIPPSAARRASKEAAHHHFVIPAKAGIRFGFDADETDHCQIKMDPGFRWDDEWKTETIEPA
jgi:hypothetical protein